MQSDIELNSITQKIQIAGQKEITPHMEESGSEEVHLLQRSESVEDVEETGEVKVIFDTEVFL